MAQMGQFNKFASGTITVESDTNTLTIDVGFPCKMFIISVKENALIADKRNLGALVRYEFADDMAEFGYASTAVGGSWSGVQTSNFDGTLTNNAVTFDGTQVKIATSGQVLGTAKFLVGRTYKWFAYA